MEKGLDERGHAELQCDAKGSMHSGSMRGDRPETCGCDTPSCVGLKSHDEG